MNFDESNENLTQNESTKESEIALEKKYCLNCNVELNDDESLCEDCATKEAPSKQGKLFVLLLVSISALVGLILLINA
jgi:hypothetical protein